MKYVVIGDVHGEFDKLLQLIEKIDILDKTPIFVGDLQDRGPKSKEVIEYVKSNNFLCVKGNHDEEMINMYECLLNVFNNVNANAYYTDILDWCKGGGFAPTLESYGLASIQTLPYGRSSIKLIKNEEGLALFGEHVEWLKTLPTYITLDITIKDKPVVISHSTISPVWENLDHDNVQPHEHTLIMWNRQKPKNVGIYNIFGHTPPGIHPEITDHYANIDTGCGKGGVLTGLILPELEFIKE